MFKNLSEEAQHTIKAISMVSCWLVLVVGLLFGNVYFNNVQAAGLKDKVYTWLVTDVYDGDTFTVDKKFFPEELGNIRVRIKGVDTPEYGSRAKCGREEEGGAKAKKWLTDKLYLKTVTIRNIQADKYGARIVADVYVGDVKIADELIRLGLANPYDGGEKKPWCNPFVL